MDIQVKSMATNGPYGQIPLKLEIENLLLHAVSPNFEVEVPFSAPSFLFDYPTAKSDIRSQAQTHGKPMMLSYATKTANLVLTNDSQLLESMDTHYTIGLATFGEKKCHMVFPNHVELLALSARMGLTKA